MTAALLDAEGFAGQFPVSRETRARLEAYAAVLTKWQKAVNLVGPKTLPDLWRRHMLDSAQLFPMIPKGSKTLMDLGSGAGFPGLVLAILAKELMPDLIVHLVEADRKKATFLQEAARIAEVRPVIHAARIETLPAFDVDIVTARALAPVGDLLNWSAPFWQDRTLGLFLKGQDIELELTAAKDFENIKIRRLKSLSDDRGCVLEVVRRA